MGRENPRFINFHQEQGKTTFAIGGRQILAGKPADWALKGVVLTGIVLGGMACAPQARGEAGANGSGAPIAKPTETSPIEFKYQATVGPIVKDGIPPTPGSLEPSVPPTPTEAKATATSTKVPEPTATKPPEPTATNTKPPEPTAVATKAPEAIKTPEGPKFGKWDNFAGELENGEPIMLSAINGQIVFASNAKKPICGTVRSRLVAVGNHDGDSFDFKIGPAKIGLSGGLENTTVSGTLSIPLAILKNPGGDTTCLAETYRFKLIGSDPGRKAFFQTFRNVFDTGARGTDQEIVDFFMKNGQYKVPTE